MKFSLYFLIHYILFWNTGSGQIHGSSLTHLPLHGDMIDGTAHSNESVMFRIWNIINTVYTC